MKHFLLPMALVLGGCSNVNGVLTPTWLGDFYDWRDDCQFQNISGDTEQEKVARMPSYCGAGAAPGRILDNNGTVIGRITH